MWPTSYHCQNLDSRSNKTNFYYSSPYLSCKRADSSLQWLKASQWSWCAAIRWILVLKNWGWFILCKMQGADTVWQGFERDAQTLLCCRGCSVTKGERKYLWEFKTHCSHSSGRGVVTDKRRSSSIICLRRLPSVSLQRVPSCSTFLQLTLLLPVMAVPKWRQSQEKQIMAVGICPHFFWKRISPEALRHYIMSATKQAWKRESCTFLGKTEQETWVLSAEDK